MKPEQEHPFEPQVNQILTAAGNDCDPAFLDTINGVRYVALREKHLPLTVQKRLARVLLLLTRAESLLTKPLSPEQGQQGLSGVRGVERDLLAFGEHGLA